MCDCILLHGAFPSAYCPVMFWSLWSLGQNAFLYWSFGVPWIRPSLMAWSTGGPPHQHTKGQLCRRQHCPLDIEQVLWDWTISFWSRECDNDRRLLVAGYWDCDWKWSNHPWGLVYVLDHVSQQNTVARLSMDDSVQPNDTSSGSWECWSWHQTAWYTNAHLHWIKWSNMGRWARHLPCRVWVTTLSMGQLISCISFQFNWTISSNH